MPDTANETESTLRALVSALPELYQPLFGFPELSQQYSRGCSDRLRHINAIHGTLAQRLGRPVRILDLGCAQGYFCLNLVPCGARVHGVDFLEQNIQLCRFLAGESGLVHATFQTARIEDVISEIAPGQYDMVLGLSVFHHLVHEHGVAAVRRMISGLARKIPAGIFELALKEEPLYWGSSQSDEPAEILRDYAFVHELDRFSTHLSETRRPMYFASDSLWFLNDTMGSFDSFKTESHSYACGCHQGSRRYYFGMGYIVKHYRMDIPGLKGPNMHEHTNEVAFLSLPADGFKAPRLLLHGNNESESWLVREMVEGNLLAEYFDSSAFIDENSVVRDVLEQLVALETNGLYHNDIRAWNVVLSKSGRAFLIDYGAISRNKKDCCWPHDVILAFLLFVREVFSRKVLHPDPVRSPLLNLEKLPASYSNAFARLLALPEKEWGFRRLLQILSEEGEYKEFPKAFSSDGVVKILATFEEASVLYENALHHYRTAGKQAKAHIDAIEEAVGKRIGELRGDITAMQRSLEAKFHELELRTLEMESAVRNSRSWNITAPCRALGDLFRSTWQGFKNLFKPAATASMRFVITRPFLKSFALYLLRPFPSLKARLKQLALARRVVQLPPPGDASAQETHPEQNQGVDIE